MSVKRWWILLGYCMPYAFLALWGDAAHGTMLPYLPMAAAFFLLCNAAAKLRSMPVVIIGNLLSAAVSGVCLTLLGPRDMAAYFKPFTEWSLLLMISAAAAGLQLVYAWHKIRRQG